MIEMSENEIKWAERLRAFITDRRLQRPLPKQEHLSDAEHQQLLVILDQMENKEDFLRPTLFTSNAAGLVAIQKLYLAFPKNLFLMYRDECEQFEDAYRNEILFRGYYHFWNEFEIWNENKNRGTTIKQKAPDSVRIAKAFNSHHVICEEITQQGYVAYIQHRGWSGCVMAAEGHSFIWRYDGENLICIQEYMSYIS